MGRDGGGQFGLDINTVTIGTRERILELGFVEGGSTVDRGRVGETGLEKVRRNREPRVIGVSMLPEVL